MVATSAAPASNATASPTARPAGPSSASRRSDSRQAIPARALRTRSGTGCPAAAATTSGSASPPERRRGPPGLAAAARSGVSPMPARSPRAAPSQASPSGCRVATRSGALRSAVRGTPGNAATARPPSARHRRAGRAVRGRPAPEVSQNRPCNAKADSLVSPWAPNPSSGAAARAGPPSSASRSGAEALPTLRANSALTARTGPASSGPGVAASVGMPGCGCTQQRGLADPEPGR